MVPQLATDDTTDEKVKMVEYFRFMCRKSGELTQNCSLCGLFRPTNQKDCSIWWNKQKEKNPANGQEHLKTLF